MNVCKGTVTDIGGGGVVTKIAGDHGSVTEQLLLKGTLTELGPIHSTVTEIVLLKGTVQNICIQEDAPQPTADAWATESNGYWLTESGDNWVLEASG